MCTEIHDINVLKNDGITFMKLLKVATCDQLTRHISIWIVFWKKYRLIWISLHDSFVIFWCAFVDKIV